MKKIIYSLAVLMAIIGSGNLIVAVVTSDFDKTVDFTKY